MNKKLYSILKIACAIVTIALGAKFSINIGDIPITGQTLAVLGWAFFLKENESFLALIMNLIIGFCGMPVFANGSHGIDKLFGPSGGYLIGFLFSAIMVSYLQYKYGVISLAAILGLTSLGTIVILLFGVGNLILIYGFEKGIEYGFLPFWKGAILKIIIGSFIVWLIKSMIKKHSNPL